MNRLQWYLARLKTMGAQEIAHRVHERLEVRRLAKKSAPSVRREFPSLANTSYRFFTESQQQLPDFFWNTEQLNERKASLLCGALSCYEFAASMREQSYDWHRAPDTEKQWPTSFFANINYRAGNPTGDIRIVWEPARLQDLIALALLAREQDDKRSECITLLTDIVRSFYCANAPYRGVHYVSAMECGLRIISLAIAFDMVRKDLVCKDLVRNDLLATAIATLIEEHAVLIAKRLSLFSSRGNHTVAEAAGLIVAATVLAEHEQSEHWLAVGCVLMRDDADFQVLPDGGGIEQSPHYHRFVLDLFLIAYLLLNGKDQAKCQKKLRNALLRGAAFLKVLSIATTSNDALDLPRIGDTDDGFAVSPLFNTLKNVEAFIGDIPNVGDSASSPHVFAETGLQVWHPTEHLKLIFDQGPLGMPPNYGHGHADALSLWLWYRGKPVLIDNGTFAYTSDTQLRRYFRSTYAHNTVVVDGLDQATQQTNFMWVKPYTVKSIDDSNYDMAARHDGYMKIGVVHTRKIQFDPVLQELTIVDDITGVGEHQLELLWHLQHTVNAEENGFVVPLTDAEALRINIEGGQSKLHMGARNNRFAGYSPCYGSIENSQVIVTSQRVRLPHRFVTKMSLVCHTREQIS